jgi:hypothetical protein
MAQASIFNPHLKKPNGLSQLALQLCVALACAFLVYAAICSVANGFWLARQRFQFDYEEGNVLNAAVRINAGLTPYPPPGSWPVVLNCYGPIPYLLTASLIRFRAPEFFRPRTISLIGALVVGFEIGLLVFHFTRSRLLALSLSVFFLSIPQVQEWAPLLRADLLGLALALAGLVVFFLRPRLYFIPSTLFALALLCKITFLAAPIAWAGILIRQKRWRELAEGVLAGAGVLGATVAALQWTTHGAFLFHQFGTHVDPISWTKYRSNTLEALGQTCFLVALSVVGFARSRRLSAALIYLLAVILGTVTALKLGSSSNHLLEFNAAVCVCAALALWEMQRTRGRPLEADGLVALCLAVLAAQAMAYRATYTAKGVVDECPQAYAYIRGHQRVLSENVGALILTGRQVLLSNPFVYAQLVRSGKWQPGRVEEMLQRGNADLVMAAKPRFDDQRWSEPAIKALAANYHVTRHFACVDAMLAYEPNLRR